MSASAGRVLIIPRGDYNSATTYNMLDMVYFGGKSYICKQTSTGNDPTNTVYWQIMLDGASEFSALSDVELNNLQDGDGIYWDATAQKWKNTTPTSIAITSPPATVDYTAGDILDLTGIVVTAYYTGGSTRNVTGECTFSPSNGTTLTTLNTSVTITWKTFSTSQSISVTAPIYGVEWDGSSSPAWTRTDSAVGFADPVPYYAGMTDTPSSPFDDILPWSGMVKVTDAEAGELVAIPKFYYKLTQPQPGVGLKIQISSVWQTGFVVSPAHMDRGDGEGERDIVYIGRYKCNNSNAKSTTSIPPMTGKTRSEFRTLIHNLGSDIWQSDFAMRFTIWLLYLVEYANWNSQKKIGYGCGNNSSSENMGYSDSMPYHTGTMASARTQYNSGTQYRYIEGLWSNVYEWIDGCNYGSSTEGLLIIISPSDFADSGGISVGIPTGSGFITAFFVSDVNGTFPLIIPSAGNGSASTGSCDMWYFDANNPAINMGGAYSQTQNSGLFFVSRSTDTWSSGLIGGRIMKLPNAS